MAPTELIDEDDAGATARHHSALTDERLDRRQPVPDLAGLPVRRQRIN
jgi:hypothetical protein